MATTLTEFGHHTGDFIISEATGNRSRDNAILSAGQSVVAGQVLSKSGEEYVAYESGTAAGIALSNYDASDADLPIVVVARDAEVIGLQLVWSGDGGSPGGSPDDADVVAGVVDLEARGIMVRY